MPASRLAYVLVTAALCVPAVPAAAAPPSTPGCATASGRASADLIRVNAAGGLRIAASEIEISTTRAAATARGVAGPLALPAASQVAPPAPGESASRVGWPAVDVGVASAGTGNLRAAVGWPAGARCTDRSASASATLASAAVANALTVPGAVTSATEFGTAKGAASVTARTGVAELRLAGGVTVRVLTSPALTAIATGTASRSSVRYTAPLVDVTGPAGTTRELDAPGKQVDVPVPGAVLRVSVGAVSQQVTGTTVTAEAATLRVQCVAGGVTRFDIGVGVLQVSATAPTSPPVTAPAGALAVTGVNVGWLIGIGMLTAILGRLLVILSRRRTRDS